MPPAPLDQPQQSLKRSKPDADQTIPPNTTSPPTSDPRPPSKRSRKAINCEPCRASKLKCDRARPCSSCVLRGTASQCYQDSDSRDDYYTNRIDPHHEISKMRQSLATLEAHLLRGGPAPSAQPTTTSSRLDPDPPAPPLVPTKNEPDAEPPEKSVPGMLARAHGGFYTGPTSTATHLLTFRSANDPKEPDDPSDRPPSEERPRDYGAPEARRDDDLYFELPGFHIMEGLVDYYFEFCNWIYRHINQPAFNSAWDRFKNGEADRLLLATLCIIMALTIQYLPERHALTASLQESHEVLSRRYYELAKEALRRHREETRVLSLELVEVLLLRTHYLTIAKVESEEIWAIRGDLVTVGTAMGLHRDPSKWRMPRELAERRRWAWWHIVLMDRWQCFLFGRPLSFASHHFDTHLPSAAHSDSSMDKNGDFYEPNLTLFRLAHILGDIVDDAVSVRPVAYERVMERDRQLVNWMNKLPETLDLNDYSLARALASPMPYKMRLGILSVIVRTSYYHIRFTLHRPHAAAAHGHSSPSGNSRSAPDDRMSGSLDIAVDAADKLVQLVMQSRPDIIATSPLSVPAHVHWGPFHVFSAGMFFSFQLIANPEQPGASMFRANIKRVLDILSHSRGVAVADKATEILSALAPLYEPAKPAEKGSEAASNVERKKKDVLSLVRTLAFPYHDSPMHTRSTYGPQFGSPAGRNSTDSPLNSTSPPIDSQGNQLAPHNGMNHHMVPPPGPNGHPVQQNPASQELVNRALSHTQHAAHVQTTMQQQHAPGPQQGYNPQPMVHQHLAQPVMNQHGQHGQMQPQQHPPITYPHPSINPYGQHPSHAPPQTPTQMQMPMQVYAPDPSALYDGTRAMSYPPAPNDMMWGASVGMNQGEWTHLIEAVRRPDGPRVPSTIPTA